MVKNFKIVVSHYVLTITPFPLWGLHLYSSTLRKRHLALSGDFEMKNYVLIA